jgi:PAS domain S-box-containing protein
MKAPAVSDLVRGSLLFILYFGTAKLGLLMDPVGGFATTVWPPTGISLVALMTFGYRLWPAIAMGAFLVNASAGAPLLVACGMAAGNTLEALLGTYFLQRVVGFRSSLDRLRDVVGLVVLAAVLSTMVSATIGVTSGWLGGVISAVDFGKAWRTWWLGDMVSDLVVAPLLFTWSRRPSLPMPPRRVAEAGALLACLVTVSLLVFEELLAPHSSLRPFVLFPFLIWAALRFGPHGAVTATLIVSVLAIWGTTQGFGPYARESLHASLRLVQVLMGVVAVTTLLLAANVTERKQAADRLQESEQRFRQLAESIRKVFWMSDLTKPQTLYVSPAYEDLWGRTCQSLYEQPRSFLDAVHPDDQERVRAAVAKQLRGEQTAEEYRIVRPDGSIRWVWDRGFPVRDEAGCVYRVAGIAEDITERKRLEQGLRQRAEELAQAEERIRSVVDHVIDGIITIDEQGTVETLNPAAEKLFGYPAAEVIGHNVKMLMPEPYHSAHNDYLANYLRNGQAQIIGIGREVVGRRKDGSTFPMDLAVSEFHLGPRRFFTGIVRDITERKRAEEDLRRSEARKAAMLEASLDAIISIDHEGKIIDWNPAAEKSFGYPRAAVIGKDMADLILPRRLRAAHRQGLVQYLATGEGPVLGKRIEMPALRADGSEFPAELAITRIAVAGPPMFTGVVRDITERKRLEYELRQRVEELAQADRRKDDFLAMLAHELRNPLAPILTSVHIMRLRGLNDPALQRARDVIERQGGYMARLLDDLLDVSRVTRGKIELCKQPLELATVVADAIQTTYELIDSRRHQLVVSLPPEPLRLEADPTRLEQVLVNLLNNAALYTEPGGRIWLTATSESGEAVIRVRDTGVGIPADLLARIFEPFTQGNHSRARSPGGLGIGLTMVRSLVHLHGGSVTASSAGAGQGSEFVVRLPLPSGRAAERQSVPAEPGASPLSSPRPPAGRRILVIEDNVDGRDMLRDLLQVWGHQVEVAGDGLQGVAAMERQPPEVALIDIDLPGLDGYQVARQVRAIPGGNQVRLIALTGYGQPADRGRALAAGFDAHLVKPVNVEELARLLASD